MLRVGSRDILLRSKTINAISSKCMMSLLSLRCHVNMCWVLPSHLSMEMRSSRSRSSAIINGVWPSSSFAYYVSRQMQAEVKSGFTTAPLSAPSRKSSFTISRCPLSTARCSGVLPCEPNELAVQFRYETLTCQIVLGVEIAWIDLNQSPDLSLVFVYHGLMNGISEAS